MLSNRIKRLAPPPRPVPLPVACGAMMGITGSFGAIFLISGLVGTLVFTADLHPAEELFLAYSHETGRGNITEVSGTDASENDEPVYKYDYTFTSRRGVEYSGTNYTTGRQWSIGAPVSVEYVPADPTISRIQGARISKFPPWVLFILIFPTVGGTMFLSSAVSGLLQIRLLREGKIADAKILTMRETNMRINEVPVVEYIYEIHTSMGEVFQGKSKAMPTGRIGDEDPEPALYLPSHPSRNMLVDSLPLRYQLDVDGLSGQWISQGGRKQVTLYLLAWGAAIVLGGLWILRLSGIL
jgi:hypothetical protein